MDDAWWIDEVDGITRLYMLQRGTQARSLLFPLRYMLLLCSTYPVCQTAGRRGITHSAGNSLMPQGSDGDADLHPIRESVNATGETVDSCWAMRLESILSNGQLINTVTPSHSKFYQGPGRQDLRSCTARERKTIAKRHQESPSLLLSIPNLEPVFRRTPERLRFQSPPAHC
jgi:hypothetical protein